MSGWMYGITGSYVPAFFMAGGFTIVGVCLLFLVPILLPADTIQQWEKRQEIKLPPEPSETTKTWSFSSGENGSSKYYKDTKSNDYKDTYEEKQPLNAIDAVPHNSSAYQEKLPLNAIDAAPHVLLVKEENKRNSISLILEKYFSMQHLVTQEESLLCRVYSKENFYVFPSEPRFDRETDV